MAGNPAVQNEAGELRGTWKMASPYSGPYPMRRHLSVSCGLRLPQPVPAWQGVREATHEGPIAPQGRSRLAHVMGDFERAQSEDCLTLNIWTPGADSAKRPVLVWIHGGAFTSGAGSLAWYSGDQFAANGGVVAVSINYRLGALGFLCLPEVSSGNLGLLDQIAALRFIRDNIAAFGGDPDNVTVVGQSAGAASIAILMTMPQASGLFRRAILQSAPFGRIARTRDDGQRIGRRFVEVLGLKPDQATRLKSVPVSDLIAAQGELARLEKKFATVGAVLARHRRRNFPSESRRRSRGRCRCHRRHHDRHDARGDGCVLLSTMTSPKPIKRSSTASSLQYSTRDSNVTKTNFAECAPQTPTRRCSATS